MNKDCTQNVVGLWTLDSLCAKKIYRLQTRANTLNLAVVLVDRL